MQKIRIRRIFTADIYILVCFGGTAPYTFNLCH